MKAWWIAPVALCAWATAAARGQQGTAPAARSCSVVRTVVLSRADTALQEARFEDAEQLYTKMLPSSQGVVGVERALLGEKKFKDALALAQKESDAKPTDALLLQGLGEVRFRRGEMVEATLAFNKSQNTDPCLARTHYDLYRYLNLEGRMKTAQAELEKAHGLSPGDSMITRVWESTHRVRPTDAEQITMLQAQADRPDATEEQKTNVASAIKAVESHEKGDCRLASPVQTAKVGIEKVGVNDYGEGGGKSGLDVYLNGKRKRLEIDTGASGLSITRDAAKSLGLIPEAQINLGGIGDSGLSGAFLTHVDSIKIGGMEFQNCRVEVFTSKEVMPGKDGLIGTDVFRNFLVTLDFPGHVLKLGPLPRRPDDADAVKQSLGTEADNTAGMTYAEAKTDPYVAPEMKNWTPVYRSGHLLIMPTTIGNAAKKLFVLDTGAGINLISPAAAREVTDVQKDDQVTLRGINGKVNDVSTTGRMTIQFARVRQKSEGLSAIDTSGISRSTGVEIAGFLGIPTLGQLKLEIDYRDNLVNVTYVDSIAPQR